MSICEECPMRGNCPEELRRICNGGVDTLPAIGDPQSRELIPTELIFRDADRKLAGLEAGHFRPIEDLIVGFE